MRATNEYLVYLLSIQECVQHAFVYPVQIVCTTTVLEGIITQISLFVGIVFMNNHWVGEANVFRMLTNISHIPFNKDALYHNILKDALELRFHWERHVFAKKGDNFLANHHKTTHLMLSVDADNAVNKLHANGR